MSKDTSETKPVDWSKSPEGALYHTVDSYGNGDWWSIRPKLSGGIWVGKNSEVWGFIASYKHGRVSDWRNSLEERPADLFQVGDKVPIKPNKKWVGAHYAISEKWQTDGQCLTVIQGLDAEGDYRVENQSHSEFVSSEMLEAFPEESTSEQQPEVSTEETELYQRTKAWMKQIPSQEVHEWPAPPTAETRLLQAKLHMEETLDLITKGLGVELFCHDNIVVDYEDFDYGVSPNTAYDAPKTADATFRIAFINAGTQISCGIRDAGLNRLGCSNNDLKLERGTISDDGELIKPFDHPTPDFVAELARQFDKHFVKPDPWAEARCTYEDIRPGEIFRTKKFSGMRYIKMEDRNEEGNRRYIYLGSGEISDLNILREDVVYRDSVLRKYSR